MAQSVALALISGEVPALLGRIAELEAEAAEASAFAEQWYYFWRNVVRENERLCERHAEMSAVLARHGLRLGTLLDEPTRRLIEAALELADLRVSRRFHRRRDAEARLYDAAEAYRLKP